jgi:Uma2 family endonuclease
MCRVVIQQGNVTVPEWVRDRASFHRWTASEEFPEHGRVDYLAGEIWVDMSEEQAYSHNRVRARFYYVLEGLSLAQGKGTFFVDGLRVAHREADLSAVPDAVYITDASFEQMRVRQVPGAAHGVVRMEGSPDMVLEVVSDSSVTKDNVRLRELYWKAGVREFWLVDARRDPPSFDILRHTARGYAATRKQDGWVKSTVFGKSFRLTAHTNRIGNPEYSLEVR